MFDSAVRGVVQAVDGSWLDEETEGMLLISESDKELWL